VAGAAGSANSPILKARRHANTWFAFTPCARATNATMALGSIVSSTIRRFSATERNLRTRRSDPSACIMTTSSDSSLLGCQRGRPHAYSAFAFRQGSLPLSHFRPFPPNSIVDKAWSLCHRFWTGFRTSKNSSKRSRKTTSANFAALQITGSPLGAPDFVTRFKSLPGAKSPAALQAANPQPIPPRQAARIALNRYTSPYSLFP